jgi:C_GCAxxG_C_C family probable redox protein
LGDAGDASAAMALNGGVAYSGGLCGAITGAALALGMLAERRCADHPTAKRVARELTAALMAEVTAASGAVDCRTLIGMDLRTPRGHAAFLDSGIWRETCMRQIELAVGRLAPLGDVSAWNRAVAALDVGDDRTGP